MRPRNKIDTEVLRLHAEALAPLPEGYGEFALSHCGDWYAYNNGHGTQRFERSYSYTCIAQVCGEWQVMRYVYARRERSLVRRSPWESSETREFCQKWFRPSDGRLVTLARGVVDALRVGSDFPYARWDVSDFTVRIPSHTYGGGYERLNWLHFTSRAMHPASEFMPRLAFVRTALEGDYISFDDMPLARGHAETLLKAGLHTALAGFGFDGVEEWWPSIKVCMRHNRRLLEERPQELLRHLANLARLGDDIHNPALVCPTDFVRAAGEAGRRVRRLVEREAEVQERRLMEERASDPARKAGVEERRRLFGGIGWTSGDGIEFVPLVTAGDYLEEGRAMHHCVAGYWDKFGSLVLSARMGGERLATIEIDRATGRLLQCRAQCNGVPPLIGRITEEVASRIPTMALAVEAVPA